MKNFKVGQIFTNKDDGLSITASKIDDRGQLVFVVNIWSSTQETRGAIRDVNELRAYIENTKLEEAE